ncbi:MAG: DUF1077 domain-containing protein [Sphingobacteriales bacterium]|nr:MAG: DUF1077 domain-containing protein [Sphingobacteriales bacterium]
MFTWRDPFERFQSESLSSQLLQVKFVYVVCQLVALGVGIWKINECLSSPRQY